jgi:uncharacterized GH25 family protein
MFRRLQGPLALSLALMLALLGKPVLAHDVWIEPSTFSPALGQTVGVRLRVGEDLHGEPLALVPGLVNRFVVQEPGGRKPVASRLHADPAGVVRVAMPGLHIVGYYSNPSFIELPPEKFNAYLAQEGLDAITARRALRNETGAKAREIYSRCAKSLVLSGLPSEAQGDTRLGFPLELVAERNPYTITADELLPVRLTFEGRPLAGVLVVALNSLNPAEKQAARTDSDGRARFQLRAGGMWLIKAVHMVPAPAGTDADWASFWASLTFEAPRANGAGQ